jgi:hypothetical protein
MKKDGRIKMRVRKAAESSSYRPFPSKPLPTSLIASFADARAALDLIVDIFLKFIENVKIEISVRLRVR